MTGSFPWFTPYQYAGNSPIENVDLDGLENYNYRLVLGGEDGSTVIDVEFSEETWDWPAGSILNSRPYHFILPGGFDGYLSDTNFESEAQLRTYLIGKSVYDLKYENDVNIAFSETASEVVNASSQIGRAAAVKVKTPIKPKFVKPNSVGAKAAKGAKIAIQENEVTTYDDFKKRSVVGDNLEGHEVLQHANLNQRGLVGARLSTAASKNNPVIALDKSVHKEVNKAQKSINPRLQTGEENISDNIKILWENKKIPNHAVEKIRDMATKHNATLKKE